MVVSGKDPAAPERRRSLIAADDIPQWATASVLTLTEQGVIREDIGRFRPGDPLLLEELYVFVYRDLLSHGFVLPIVLDGCRVEGVPAGSELALAVCTFRRQEWLPRRGDLEDLSGQVTRAEMAQFLHTVFGPSIEGGQSLTADGFLKRGSLFTDVPVMHPNFLAVHVLHDVGVMEAPKGGPFGVDASINRAATALVLDRMNRLLEKLRIDTLKTHNSADAGRMKAL